MAPEALQRFAQELKSQREERGVTLTQISNRTKIDIKFLHAIEDARFDVLPELYIRAFIKEYCFIVDINPKAWLEKFDLIRSGKEEMVEKKEPTREISIPEKIPVIAETVPPENEKEFDSSTPVTDSPSEKKLQSKIKLNYFLGGIILLVAFIIFYIAFIHEPSNQIITNEQLSENVQAENPRFEVSESTQVNQQLASEFQSDQNKPAQTSIENNHVAQPEVKSDSLKLAIQISARVWVKVYVDGKVVSQQIVERGSNLKYNAKTKFAVSVGDAGAVKIFYNNKQVPNIGKTGESRNIYMAPDGIRYYTIPGNEKKSISSH